MKRFLFLAVLTTGFIAAAFSQATNIPTEGLVGWWPFNGNVLDCSGNSNNGTINGATLTTDRFGFENSAFSFNGSSDFISIPDATSLDLVNNFTIAAWFNPSSTQDDQGIIGKGRAIGGTGCALLHRVMSPNGTGVVAMSNSSSAEVYIANSQFSINTWHHILSTYDGSSLKLYVNGQLIDETSTTILLENSIANLFIGKELDDYRYFNGKIDDVGIWNRPLNQVEVLQLYNHGLCFESITVTDTLVINANITGYNPVTFNNTVKIYPNPSNDHITIDFGDNYSSMSGFTLKILNTTSQIVYTTTINQQQTSVNLSTWSGQGIYFVHLIDNIGNTIDVKKIVLQ